MKKLISLLLSVCLLSSAAFAAFDDVSGHWAEDYIGVCNELGLMQGVSDLSFDPDGQLNVAQAAAIAVRLSAYLGGEAEPEPGEVWYEPYMDYMEKLGCDLPEPDSMCTRALFFEMMSAVVPEKKLAAINNISRVPDSDDESLMVFYNAGILTGMDEYGTFHGELGLTRAECAAMAARIADYTLRVKFTPASWERSPSMECLALPSDAAALTIGSAEISAADFTAALTHELDVIAAEYQLEEHPDYSHYLELWEMGGYELGFERYLSEIHGVNDFEPVDWQSTCPDTGMSWADTAFERAIDSLTYSTAVHQTAEKLGIELSSQQEKEIEAAVEKYDGESRRLYAANELRDELLLIAIGESMAIGETKISSLIASGDWVCAEFVAFPKTNSDGEALTASELGYIHAGAEQLVRDVGEGQQHYRLEYLLSYVKTDFIPPRCTLWSKDSMSHELWQQLGVKSCGVWEDDANIYVYLVSDPFFDEGLTAEVGANYGADRALETAQKLASGLSCELGEAVQMLAVAEFAAKVI